MRLQGAGVRVANIFKRVQFLLHTFMPAETLPNIVCFPSSQGVGPKVIKNWAESG